MKNIIGRLPYIPKLYSGIKKNIRESGNIASIAAKAAKSWGRIDPEMKERIEKMVNDCVSSIYFPENGLPKKEVLKMLTYGDLIETRGRITDPDAVKEFKKMPNKVGSFILENLLLKKAFYIG